jgi:hypothetical protein
MCLNEKNYKHKMFILKKIQNGFYPNAIRNLSNVISLMKSNYINKQLSLPQLVVIITVILSLLIEKKSHVIFRISRSLQIERLRLRLNFREKAHRPQGPPSSSPY